MTDAADFDFYQEELAARAAERNTRHLLERLAELLDAAYSEPEVVGLCARSAEFARSEEIDAAVIAYANALRAARNEQDTKRLVLMIQSRVREQLGWGGGDYNFAVFMSILSANKGA